MEEIKAFQIETVGNILKVHLETASLDARHTSNPTQNLCEIKICKSIVSVANNSWNIKTFKKEHQFLGRTRMTGISIKQNKNF